MGCSGRIFCVGGLNMSQNGFVCREYVWLLREIGSVRTQSDLRRTYDRNGTVQFWILAKGPAKIVRQGILHDHRLGTSVRAAYLTSSPKWPNPSAKISNMKVHFCPFPSATVSYLLVYCPGSWIIPFISHPHHSWASREGLQFCICLACSFGYYCDCWSTWSCILIHFLLHGHVHCSTLATPSMPQRAHMISAQTMHNVMLYHPGPWPLLRKLRVVPTGMPQTWYEQLPTEAKPLKRSKAAWSGSLPSMWSAGITMLSLMV